jgi:DNA-binding NarL/FixJ family response regulator
MQSDLSILLTEDDADVARYLTTVLRSLGHRVVAVANDGLEAVHLANELNPDLVIMDIDLPSMDGVTAAGKILEQNSVAVIISTGRADNEVLERAQSLSIQAYLIKPFSAIQLKSAIAMSMSQYLQQDQAQRKISELNGVLAHAQSQTDTDTLPPEKLFSLGLTRREAEVMHWIAQGKSNSDIATILESSPRTVAKHIEHIFLKLKVESRTAAVAEVRQLLKEMP